MSFEISGKILEIYDENQVSEKFRKREFVIEKNENGFTEQIKFQLVQDKTNLINSFKLGDDVKVSFNIKGKKWNDNYFVNLQAWKLENIANNQQQNSMNNMPPPPSMEDVPPPGEDDLPF